MAVLTTVFYILILVHVIAAFAAVVHVLRYYRRPTAAVAWLFAVVTLVVVGPLLYLTFSVYDNRRRMRRRGARAATHKEGRDAVGDSDPGRLSADVERVYGAEPGPFQLAVESVASFPMSTGNRIEIIADGQAAFDAMINALRSAEREILVQSYAVHDDVVGKALADELAAAAGRGVAAYLLLDPMGSYALEERYLEELRDAGVHAANFLKPNAFKGRFQVNSRNHRKILTVDGRLGITGGRNWGEPYFLGVGETPGFRDLTVVVEGPAVEALRRVVQEDWCVEHNCKFDEFTKLDPPAAAGEVSARVVPHGVDEVVPTYPMMAAAALRNARRRVVVLSPYFVPGPEMHDHLLLTARSGIDVKLVIAHKSDSRFADLAARYYFDTLLDAGVEVILVPPPMLHGKAMLVDDDWAIVGSTNFDCRSFHLNYEVNLEIVDRAVCAQLGEAVAAIAAEGHKVDAEEFAGRGHRRRMVENAAALFGPIL